MAFLFACSGRGGMPRIGIGAHDRAASQGSSWMQKSTLPAAPLSRPPVAPACPGTPTAGCRRRPPWARMGIAAGAGRRAGQAVRRAGAAGRADVAREGRRGVGDDQVPQGIDVLVAVRDAVLQPVARTRLVVAGPVSLGRGQRRAVGAGVAHLLHQFQRAGLRDRGPVLARVDGAERRRGIGIGQFRAQRDDIAVAGGGIGGNELLVHQAEILPGVQIEDLFGSISASVSASICPLQLASWYSASLQFCAGGDGRRCCSGAGCHGCRR